MSTCFDIECGCNYKLNVSKEYLIKTLRKTFVKERDILGAKYLIDKYKCNPLLIQGVINEIISNHSINVCIHILEEYGLTYFKTILCDNELIDQMLVFVHVDTVEYGRISDLEYRGSCICDVKNRALVSVACFNAKV